jgi:hypothetical protein
MSQNYPSNYFCIIKLFSRELLAVLDSKKVITSFSEKFLPFLLTVVAEKTKVEEVAEAVD